MNKGIGWLILLGFGLLGCVQQAEVSEVVATVPVTRVGVEEEATDVPLIRPSPTYASEIRVSRDGRPVKSLVDVRCGDLTEGVEEKSYWVDNFIPGESTIEELLQIIEELQEEKKPIQYGDSSYGNPEGEDYYLLIFDLGILFSKYEPRIYLGDIINYYGEPVQVSWKVLLNRSAYPNPGVPAEEADTTSLFFPQSNAWFTAYGQITHFNADTIFEGSAYPPSVYEEIYTGINSEVSTSKVFVQHFPWPCG